MSNRSRYNNTSTLSIGDVVLISDPSEGIGVVRHIDDLSFIIGIELTDPLGTSDGVRGGERYFKCRPRYGIFVSVSDIVRLVSPEELLHKIVVLNRALAHKHSTLTNKNQSIDKLKKEIISLQQTLKTYVINQDTLTTEMNELKQENKEYKQYIQQYNNQLIEHKHNDPLSLLDPPKKILSNDLLQQIQNINYPFQSNKKNKQYHQHRSSESEIITTSNNNNNNHSYSHSMAHHTTNLNVDDDGIDNLSDHDNNNMPNMPKKYMNSISPAQPLNEEGSIELDGDILLDDIIPRTNNNNYHLNINKINKTQTLNRESKPQTPDHNTSDDDDSSINDNDNNTSDTDTSTSGDNDSSINNNFSPTDESDDHSHQKPCSQPNSRRGSFLREYPHHLYDNNEINRDIIIDRGKKINNALSNYNMNRMNENGNGNINRNRNRNNNNKKHRNKRRGHSREISNEQLGFMPQPMSPISSSHHSRSLSHHSNHSLHSNTNSDTPNYRNNKKGKTKKKSKHRKGKSSNVEEAAKKLRKEINKKSKQILKQQKQYELLNNNLNNISEEELLSDDDFIHKYNKFNTSNTSNKTKTKPPPIQKRFSQSQPTSPHTRYENEFIFDHNPAPKQAKYVPKLRTSLSNHNSRMKYSWNDGSKSAAINQEYNVNAYKFANDNQNNQNKNKDKTKKTLQPTSKFRKNRDAFLKQMDKKLEEVMYRFESKNNCNDSPTISRPISAKMFHSKPLIRKRGQSYHENSNTMQQIIRETSQKNIHHKASQSTTFNNINKKYEWMTTKTTFSKYNNKLKMENNNKQYEIDSVFSKQPTFEMIPRRSISLPSSPKHNNNNNNNNNTPTTTRMDSLDLGDDGDIKNGNVNNNNNNNNINNISDQSSISDDNNDNNDDNNDNNDNDNDSLPDEDDLYVSRKESQKIQYDRSIRRRRLRRGLKRNKWNRNKRNNNNNNNDIMSTSDDNNTTSDSNNNKQQIIYDDDMDDDMDDMEIPDVHNDDDDDNDQSIQDEEEEEEEEEDDDDDDEQETYYRRTRLKQRRKRYHYKDDSDSEIDPNQEIIDSDDEQHHGNNVIINDNNNHNNNNSNNNDELIDLDEEQYKYYQTKKRNSKVHLLDKDEFEKEYNSINSMLQ